MRCPTIGEACCAIPFFGMFAEIFQVDAIEDRVKAIKTNSTSSQEKTDLIAKARYTVGFSAIGNLAFIAGVIALAVLSTFPPSDAVVLTIIACWYMVLAIGTYLSIPESVWHCN